MGKVPHPGHLKLLSHLIGSFLPWSLGSQEPPRTLSLPTLGKSQVWLCRWVQTYPLSPHHPGHVAKKPSPIQAPTNTDTSCLTALLYFQDQGIIESVYLLEKGNAGRGSEAKDRDL